MTRWTGERIGRLSLKLDAAYCAVLGIGVAVAAPAIDDSYALPAPLIVAAGLAVAAWALLVILMLRRLALRTALRSVLAVNVVAALVVAGVSVTGTATLAVLAAIAIACDIALFAGSQAVALRRLRAAA